MKEVFQRARQAMRARKRTCVAAAAQRDRTSRRQIAGEIPGCCGRRDRVCIACNDKGGLPDIGQRIAQIGKPEKIQGHLQRVPTGSERVQQRAAQKTERLSRILLATQLQAQEVSQNTAWIVRDPPAKPGMQ